MAINVIKPRPMDADDSDMDDDEAFDEIADLSAEALATAEATE